MADWLKKQGTDECFMRTAQLATREDMFPIDESEVMKIRAKKAKPVKIAEPVIVKMETPKTEAPVEPVDPIDEMDEAGLRALASQKKIALGPNMKVENMRKKLKAVIEEDSVVIEHEGSTGQGSVGTEEAGSLVDVYKQESPK